jgi:asparagine synthase (glutamine-hydrolysing)
MCGIFALLNSNDDSIEYFSSGSKRGPEFSTLINIKGSYLGFHRLAINGLNDESNQPIYYKDCILICNGEIYNYKELITKYNLNVKTQSDCEVIPALYYLFGENFINYLDGEFSFIMIDMFKNITIIGRDPYGVRPLYMNNIGNKYCFSSDMEPMKCMPIATITQFTPGQIMTIGETVVINQYHVLQPVEQTNTTTEFYDLVCKAVKKRVNNCERPVACLLSGGLDSSLVAALAARYSKELGRVLETYSIGLVDSEDLKYAKKVADHIGSKHTQIVFNEDDFYNSIPAVIKDIESYDTTTVRASVGNWNLGKYIKEHSDAKVILNGDGADELMGGYIYFNACPSAEEFDTECKRLLSNIHCFDVLRSDKSIASHGLEPRTPFLDKELVNYYLNIPADIRAHIIGQKQEKYFIRNVFNTMDSDLLPQEILFRQKEAFSDGVSCLNRSWYEIIQEKVKDVEIPDQLFVINPPITKEQQYYRSIFESYYPNCGNLIPYFWMPKYVDATDASARTLSFYSANVV